MKQIGEEEEEQEKKIDNTNRMSNTSIKEEAGITSRSSNSSREQVRGREYKLREIK